MKKTIFLALFSLTLFAAVAQNNTDIYIKLTPPPPPRARLLFEDKFIANNPPQYIINYNNWAFVDGYNAPDHMLVYGDQGDGTGLFTSEATLLVINNSSDVLSVSDGKIEQEFHQTIFVECGVVFRYQDVNNYYYLSQTTDYAESPNMLLKLRKVVNGTETIISTTDTQIPWEYFRDNRSSSTVSFVGNTFIATVNANSFNLGTDNTFSSGKIGFKNRGGSNNFQLFHLKVSSL